VAAERGSRAWRAARRGAAALAAGLALAAGSAAEPVRVASLLPFVGAALALVPEQATVVAAARSDLRTPVAAGVVDLGNPHAPDLEGLAAAKPALVVGDRALHGRLREDLARGGADVLLLDTTGVDATLDGLVTVGERVGATAPLRARADAVRAALAGLRLDPAVRALALFGTPDSFFVVTGRTWLGDLLLRLGFALPPVAESGSERFPGFVPVSDELLVTLRPELVLLVAHGDPRALREALVQKTSQGGPWSALGRSATRGVRVLDPRTFSANPGFGLDGAARALVALASEPAGAGAGVGAGGW
jgi:iron complex transport system substrate-binding protein